MKINWKVRFKNKVWLTSFISLIIGFAYSMVKLFDVVPSLDETIVLNVICQVLEFLGLIGVLVDPTTAGLSDSNRAMSYQVPYDDNAAKEVPNG